MISGLFGGTFDPFHAGHLALVRHLLDRDFVDRVLVVPAGRNPFRDSPVAAGEHRAAMARAALAGLPSVVVDDCEIRRRGPSYTIDTLRRLRAAQPAVRWRLVIGSDQLDDFARWREATRIVSLADAVLVIGRGGWDGTVPRLLCEAAIVVRDYRHPASGSRIRRELAAGDARPRDLPAPVAAYISAYGLYGPTPSPAEPPGREES
jgi:nicotinate-nucleotide adenylyltransferase